MCLRLAAVLLSIVLVAAVAAGVPSAPASAAVVTSCTNSGCPDPSGWSSARWQAHAGYPSNGGTVDGANCTNYAAWRLIATAGLSSSMVSGLGNASTWDSRAKTKGFLVNKIPAVGAVAQWDANHVAYVEQVNGDGTIVISESNVWVGDSSTRKWLRYRQILASAVDHFIHFRDVTAQALLSLIAPGDFDGDGFGDLLAVRTDGTLTLYSGDGAGGLLSASGSKIASGWTKYRLISAAGDFTGDHRADVMAVDKGGRLYLYRGDGAGGWTGSRKKIADGWEKKLFVFSPGDFSGDGKSDVLAVQSDGRLALYDGNGKGGWQGSRVIVGTGFATATAVGSPGDFDGDGKADVIAVWPDGTVTLYSGDGKKGLLDPEGVVIATGWTDVTGFAGRGDVTGDDLTDVFAVRLDSELFLHAGDGAELGTGVQLGVTW
ncbi:MAG: FG-GAP-like repeat-containing protein [Pseudolysinimonas sp.]